MRTSIVSDTISPLDNSIRFAGFATNTGVIVSVGNIPGKKENSISNFTRRINPREIAKVMHMSFRDIGPIPKKSKVGSRTRETN
jgi:hypothetical protein